MTTHDTLLPMDPRPGDDKRESVTGRPDFIPREVFRAYVSVHEMGKHCRIGGLTVHGYIGQCERKGRPIKPSCKSGKLRLIDVVARGRAMGLAITPSVKRELKDTVESLKQEIAELQAKADEMKRQVPDLERHLAIHHACAFATGKVLLREDELVEASEEYSPLVGVYFLIKGHRVVYVGQSVNVHSRISAHKDDRKDFDRWAMVACKRDELDVVESLYIHMLRPPLNGVDARGDETTMVAPLSLKKLLAKVA